MLRRSDSRSSFRALCVLCAAAMAFSSLLGCDAAGGDEAPAASSASIAAALSTFEGLDVTRVETHDEYTRYFIRDGAHEVGIEIVRVDGEEGPWSTETHRLMPAPGDAPSRDVLLAMMTVLREQPDVLRLPTREQTPASDE